MNRIRLRLSGLAVAVVAALAPLPLAAQADPAAALAGTYLGGAVEIGAGLELGADGRFRYGLSYGALDERAEGRWQLEDGQVLLTSDPVVAPRFVLVGQRAVTPRQFAIVLDLPGGLSRQYFDVLVRYDDDSVTQRSLADDPGPLRLEPGRRAVSVIVSLEVFDVRSAVMPLTGDGGHELRVRFEPNDLGKVAFARQPLVNDGGVLVLERHGRKIGFRRDAP